MAKIVNMRHSGPITRATEQHGGEWFAVIPAAAIFDPDLTDAAFRAYAAGAAFAGPDRIIRQAQGTIARKLGCWRQLVNRWWKKAQDLGWLELVQGTSKSSGGRGLNVYRVIGFKRRLGDRQSAPDAHVEGGGHSPTGDGEAASATAAVGM
jgi:hypothetical protein